MRVLHIKGSSLENFKLSSEALQKLPETLGLCTTIQFIDHLPNVIKQLENANKKVTLLQGEHSTIKGQILGCDVPIIKNDIESILFIGDGEFHPKALFLKNNLPVFVYNPYNSNLKIINEQEIEQYSKKRKIALTKFYASDNIGIIITTKSGQKIFEDRVKKIYAQFPNKKFYRFVADTIDFSQLENFQFIESWINTACPRIAYDDSFKINKAILNMDDLENENNN